MLLIMSLVVAYRSCVPSRAKSYGLSLGGEFRHDNSAGCRCLLRCVCKELQLRKLDGTTSIVTLRVPSEARHPAGSGRGFSWERLRNSQRSATDATSYPVATDAPS